MSYRAYNLNEDIKIIFKTVPLTPNINPLLLRCSYYNKDNNIRFNISGNILEDNGVYLTPNFQISEEGTYVIEMEYDLYKDGSTWKRVGISEFYVGNTSTNSGGTGGSVSVEDWRVRAVV